jgi:phasin family protein
MISLPEQLTAARKWQFEAQLDFFHALTSQVFARTEQVISLNLETSRAAVERTSKAVKQLFAIDDPRDLVTIGSQGQQQFEQMLAYSRELFSIASGAPLPQAAATPWATPWAAPLTPPAAPVEATPWTPPAPVEATPRTPPAPVEATPRTPPASQDATARQAAPANEPASAPAPDEAGPAAAKTWQQMDTGVRPSKKPLVAAFPEGTPGPAAQHTPIAEAAMELSPHAAEPQHPLSSPMAAATDALDIPPIAPVEAAPPPAPVSGTPEIDVKQGQRTKSRGSRKK